VLVRHPLDATVSVYNYFRMRSSHTQTATLDKFIKGGKVTKGEEMREDHHACLATLMDMNKRIGDGRFQGQANSIPYYVINRSHSLLR